MAEVDEAFKFFDVKPSEVLIALAFAFAVSMVFYWLGFSGFSVSEFLVVAAFAFVFVRLFRFLYGLVKKGRHDAGHEEKP